MDDQAPHPAILASDHDRDQTIERLTTAVSEGRLSLEEFGDRVGIAQTARSQDDLAGLTRDLPARAVTVTVPDGVQVDVSGGGPFASEVIDTPPHSSIPNAPRLRIHTRGSGGTLYVRRPKTPPDR
jgi:hypothetical protein